MFLTRSPCFRPAVAWTALVFWLVLGSASALAEAGSPRLIAVGDDLDDLSGGADLAAGRWQALSLDGRDLMITPVTAVRASDWTAATGNAEQGWTSLAQSGFEATGQSLDLPRGALFGLRLLDVASDRRWLASGRYRSALRASAVLRVGWQAQLQLGQQRWTVMTRHQHRADGHLLAGSIRLVAIDASGATLELMGQATGMAFHSQELLWLGDLDGDHRPDMLLKRQWLTGEYEYLLVVAGQHGVVMVDPVRPYQGFSSGIENSASLSRHRTQIASLPGPRFGKAALNITESEWNPWASASTGLPTRVYDRSLGLEGETLRVTVDSLPTANYDPARVDTSTAFWGSGLLVRVHFRGRSQVLMNAGGLDGGRLRLQLDQIDGQPALQIQFQPHYNNGFTHYWRWSEDAGGRFKRLVTYQEQGC